MKKATMFGYHAADGRSKDHNPREGRENDTDGQGSRSRRSPRGAGKRNEGSKRG
jgi:hypothetical protein